MTREERDVIIWARDFADAVDKLDYNNPRSYEYYTHNLKNLMKAINKISIKLDT